MKKQIEKIAELSAVTVAASGTVKMVLDLRNKLCEGFAGVYFLIEDDGTCELTAKIGPTPGTVLVPKTLAASEEILATAFTKSSGTSGADYIDITKNLGMFAPVIELTFTETGGADAIDVTAIGVIQ